MKKDIFDYSDYKQYLQDFINSKPGGGRGWQARFAEKTGCRSAYISQVLNKDAYFSPEQAESLNELLGHSLEEGDFFLLLIQLGKAGSVQLKNRLKRQIDQIRQKRLVLKDRVDIKKTLSEVDQATYYSAWYYAAVHIASTISELQTKEALAKYFGFSGERISEIVAFLESVGLVESTHGKLKPGVSRLFLGSDSPMIARHHTNWRMRAIDSLDKGIKEDLHFSTVVSLASEDILKMKEYLVKSIESARAIVRESKAEEELYCFCLDYFRV